MEGTMAGTQDVNIEGNAFGELDESAELQLHPLKDSTWAEVFPILSFL
jgi:hypothetical protein